MGHTQLAKNRQFRPLRWRLTFLFPTSRREAFETVVVVRRITPKCSHAKELVTCGLHSQALFINHRATRHLAMAWLGMGRVADNVHDCRSLVFPFQRSSECFQQLHLCICWLISSWHRLIHTFIDGESKCLSSMP